MKHPDVRISIESDPEIYLMADEFHFTNLVQNLLDNSIKYSDETPEIKISSKETSKGIQLDFTDNGIGVPEKSITYIFDKFYRVADQKSNEVNGFGLGLYYVKRIVRQHGWKISAKNNAEKGITISIFIPNK